MGFFQDLKEDLSQAVNELIPDDKSILDKEVKEEQNANAVEEASNLNEEESEEWLDDEELDELVSEAIGDKIEKSLGIRRDVNSTNNLNGNPLLVTISTNLNDCVNHNIDNNENATKKKPTHIWRKMYKFSFFIERIIIK